MDLYHCFTGKGILIATTGRGLIWKNTYMVPKLHVLICFPYRDKKYKLYGNLPFDLR